MRMLTNKKAVSIIAGGALTATLGGVAFAYWTAGGEGTGTTATTAGESNLVVTQTSAGSPLYPGAPAQDISGNINNAAENAAYVASVVVTVVGTDKGADCDASNFAIANGTMPVATDIGAGEDKGFAGASISFVNKATNQDACKDATVNLKYVAS